MVQPKPCKLSFRLLEQALRCTATDKKEYSKLLDETHKFVFYALKNAFSSLTESSSVTSVTYRPGIPTTEAHPQPVEAENACIESIRRYLGVPRAKAAVLLRDYFLEEVGNVRLSEMLQSNSDFESLVSMKDIEEFWRKECKAMFSVMLTIFANARPRSIFPQKEACISFLKKHEETLVDLIVNLANRSMEEVGVTVFGPENAKRRHLDPVWALEVLFASVTHYGLPPEYFVAIVDKLRQLAQRPERVHQMRSPTGAKRQALLDGERATLLVIFSLCRGTKIAGFAILNNDFIEDDPDVEVVDPHDFDFSELGLPSYLINLARIARIDKVMSSLKDITFVETSLILFSWSSFLALRRGLEETVDEKDRFLDMFPVDDYMLRAMAGNPFVALRNIVSRIEYLDDRISSEVHLCVWEQLTAFLSGFPPKGLRPSEVEIVVEVAYHALQGLDHENLKRISENIWDRENGRIKRWIGPNCLLRLASGVFPQTFQPLVQLLTALIVDERSAERACATLEKGLDTVTEPSDSYAQYLIGIDEEAVFHVLHADRRISDEVAMLREEALSLTSPSETQGCFVQAKRAIEALDMQRPTIPEGSVGSACQETGMVTWTVNWNGWGALFHVLQVLGRLLQEHGATSFSESVLDNLITAVIRVLRLIEWACHNGSPALQTRIGTELPTMPEMLPIVTALLLEVADPGDWAQGSWLTQSRRKSLLDASSSCLAVMAIGSLPRAQYVLERVRSSKGSIQPLQSALSSMGVLAFPAIAAMASIAGSYQLETQLPNGIDMDALITRTPRQIGSARLGRSSVTKLLIDLALPVWLSTALADGSDDNSWLLPACALDFLQGATEVVHSSPVAAVISRVVTAAVSLKRDESVGNSSQFFYVALRASLELCVAGLKRLHFDCNTSESKTKELTTLQKSLIDHDVVSSLALLSSGCVAFVKDNGIWSKQASTYSHGCVRAFDKRYSSLIDEGGREGTLKALSRRKMYIEDMAAQCLSYLCFGLQSCAGNEDIVQIPWPVVGESGLVMKHPGGERIREGIAKRIEKQGSVACVDLLVNVLSCGQRAAARSVLGPYPGKKEDATATHDKKEAECAKSEHVVLSAVTNAIKQGVENWVSIVNPDANGATEDPGSCDHEILLLSKCIAFLRVSWESQNNVWFRKYWEDNNVWNLLASLLKCEGSIRKRPGTFDASHAVKSSYRKVYSEGIYSGEGAAAKDIDIRVRKARELIDVPSTWRSTMSNVLAIFASELLLCTGNASKQSAVSNSDEGSNAQAKKIGEQIFAEPPFQAFGEVFTEKWVHVFLQPEDWLMFPKAASLTLTDDMDLGQDTVFSGLTWSNSETLEKLTDQLSKELSAKIGPVDMPKGAHLLEKFSRHRGFSGGFGPNYAFDIESVWCLLKRIDMVERDARRLVVKLMHLNSLWGRADAQLSLTRSFAAMTYSVIFVDLFAPVPGKALTYASPQFNGKLCRCLARFILSIRSASHFSASGLETQLEMAMLISFLASRLTAEELEQPALTAIRFTSEVEAFNNEFSLSALGQLCLAIDRMLVSVREVTGSSNNSTNGTDVIRWLLIAASHLNRGSSFKNEEDMTTLGKTSFSVLRTLPGNSHIAQAASIALMSLRNGSPARLSLLLMRLNATEHVFSSIAAMERHNDNDQKSSLNIATATSSLLLMLAQVLTWLPDNSEAKSSSAQLILRHLSGGTISAIFPRGASPIRTYLPTSLTRDPVHVAWCACLALASIAICHVPDSSDNADQHVLDVLEFCASNMERISRESLDLSGDWPPMDSSGDSKMTPSGIKNSRHLTIARLEEAELAAHILFQLSAYSIRLRDSLPDITTLALNELIRYVYQAYRHLRAEPLERWIKPVSAQERSRSEYLGNGRDQGCGPGAAVIGNSPWQFSPAQSFQPSSPRRSPLQALRAAIGGSGSKTPRYGGLLGFAPPSPGMPPTPGMPGTPQLMSPMSNAARSSGGNGKMSVVPGSPWTPHGAGLITEGGMYFGEECSRALLRGVNFALAALRRFGQVLDEPFFGPTMVLWDDVPGLGILAALQYHACNEIQRGAEGGRRELLMTIVDNALHLTMAHLVIFADLGRLAPAFRDEIKKRIYTVVLRLRSVVPPPPASSLIYSKEVTAYLDGLV